MAQDITLSLPDKLYDPIRRMTEATHQPVEGLVLSALQASLPSMEGLPQDLAHELSGLELYENDALERVMKEILPKDEAQEIEQLLHSKQAATLTASQEQRLNALQRAADRIMLRKARAAVLLRFRGQWR